MKEYTLIRRTYAIIGFVVVWGVIVAVFGYALTPRVVEVDMAQAEVQRLTYTGLASFYDYDLPGANGYSTRHRTAASRDFVRGTFVSVTNLENGQKTCVRINDFVDNFGVIIDLSSLAFADLAPLSHGLVKVELREVTSC